MNLLMMIGKEDDIKLSDIIIEALKEIGHRYQEYGSNRQFQRPETLAFQIEDSHYNQYDYKIEVDGSDGTAKFMVGIFPKFTFHDPNGILMFKMAAMQMPMIVMLTEFGDRIANLNNL